MALYRCVPAVRLASREFSTSGARDRWGGVDCGLRCADDDSFLREAQSEPPPHPSLPLFRPISRPSQFLLHSPYLHSYSLHHFTLQRHGVLSALIQPHPALPLPISSFASPPPPSSLSHRFRDHGLSLTRRTRGVQPRFRHGPYGFSSITTSRPLLTQQTQAQPL